MEFSEDMKLKTIIVGAAVIFLFALVFTNNGAVFKEQTATGLITFGHKKAEKVDPVEIVTNLKNKDYTDERIVAILERLGFSEEEIQTAFETAGYATEIQSGNFQGSPMSGNLQGDKK